MVGMATTLDEFLVDHPVDRGKVEGQKKRMLSEVRAQSSGQTIQRRGVR